MTESTTPAGGVNPAQQVPPVQQPAVIPPATTETPLTTQLPQDPTQPVDPNAAPPVSDPNATVPPATETGQGDEQERTRQGKGARERIQELVARSKAAEAERDAAWAELERLRRPLQTQVPYDQLPFEQQEQVRLREAVRAERAEQMAYEANFRQQQVVANRHAVFTAKLAAAEDRMPEVAEKFFRIDPTSGRPAVPVSEVAADFIAESDKAAEIAYFLGTNPHEARRIAQLPDTRQTAELARLEARLSAAPTVRRVSQAPAPVTTVGGGSPPRMVDLGTVDYETYKAQRMKKP